MQVCREIRLGGLRRPDAQRKHKLSAALIQTWLTRFDDGRLEGQAPAPLMVAEYGAKITALGRKIGQLTMEMGLLKKTPRLRLVSIPGPLQRPAFAKKRRCCCATR
ncbi:hypothetical protein ABIC63_002816 [Pseudacidovorax sp. 1753]|uniref:transposase n=1 Tax=Pseudacidovorax sp. 1753 TaxID=3156419 RepID=UPI0033953EBC